MIIRKAQQGDAHGIATVHVESWKTTYAGVMPDSVIENLDKSFERRKTFWAQLIEENEAGHILYVAESDGKIVGFSGSGEPQDGGLDTYDCELYTVYLLKSEQGKGLGRKLMEANAKELHERGFKSMFLWVLEGNVDTRGFYEYLGGKLIAKGDYEIAGTTFVKLAYGWSDIRQLIPNED